MIQYSIYVVDDEETITYGIYLTLKDDFLVKTFSDAESAISVIKKEPPDLLLLDIGLPNMDGIEAMKAIKKIHPEILVIFITGFEDIKTVVKAMKLGAYDYVAKPLQMDSLKLIIRNGLESIRLKKEVQLLQAKYLKENIPCFIGESDIIQDVMQVVYRVAQSPDTSVLILGETGTGKELIASSIHYRSPNYSGPFVLLNCASLPGELIESELFGYERGAFSGARKSGKKGLIEMAENGTLFLDEIGDMSMKAQAKLLRFMDEGTFYKVGGTKKQKINTRIISATNKDLEMLSKSNKFRLDLYFRLAVIKIEVPSLNKRRDDIIPIARHFVFQFNERFGKKFTGIDSLAEEKLIHYDWKGNVRELRNVIERGMILGQGPELFIKDLVININDTNVPDKAIPPPLPPEGIDLVMLQQSIDRFYIEKALTLSGGNKSKAARLLKLKLPTFHYKAKNFDFSQPETNHPPELLNSIHLPTLTNSGIDLDSLQQSIEKFYFDQALAMAADQKTKAAKLLNLKNTTFYYRRKRHI